jgi:hypothetical protein
MVDNPAWEICERVAEVQALLHMLRIFRAIGAELNIAATNTIPPLNPSRKGSDPSQIRDMFSTP